MKTALDPVAEIAAAAVAPALPEFVSVGALTFPPRGADPFVGTERPMLLTATRWLAAAPGGVLFGGSPEAMAAILGFDLPERPTPVPAEERDPDAPPPPKYADLVAEAALPVVTTISQAVAAAVAGLVDLPPECAPSSVSMHDTDAQVRTEVGPLPDAAIVMLHADEHDVRMLIVVPGIFAARMGRKDAEADAGGAAPDDETGDATPDATDAPTPTRHPTATAATLTGSPLGAALARVPLDLSIELGRARVPLAQVLHLSDGEVIELRQSVDDPVDLVSESTTVARGDLEVSDSGNLVLHVTSVPGQAPRPAPPTMMADLPPDESGGAAADDDPSSIGVAGDAEVADGSASAGPTPDAESGDAEASAADLSAAADPDRSSEAAATDDFTDPVVAQSEPSEPSEGGPTRPDGA